MTDMDPAFPIAVDELFEHSAWMRALARQLVHDAAAADDVVQEAFLAALRRARGGEPAQRGWLARVIYKQAALNARRERHRLTREERAALDEALPSSAELVASAEMLKRVVEAVVELRDPYRSVLLLRYYENLSPDEIAKRQGVPGSTVRNQLARGLAQLRERLDELHGGDRRAWSLALVPLAVERDALVVGAGVSSTLIAGLIAMPLHAKLIVSALIAVALWLALFLSEPGVAQPTVVAEVPVDVLEPRDPTNTAEPIATSGAAESRSEVDIIAQASAPSSTMLEEAPAAQPQTAEAPDLEARAWVTFRVTNEGGLPVAGAQVGFVCLYDSDEEGSGAYWWPGELASGSTGADGRVRLPYPVWIDREVRTGAVFFTVTHPGYATLDSDAEVAPEREIPAVLHAGCTLTVCAWIDEPSNVVREWRALFSRPAGVNPEDWQPHRDGRWSTTRVSPGDHVILVRHERADGVVLLSEPKEFSIALGEDVPLSLELKPARRLVGELDKDVPRPIVDGHAWLHTWVTHSSHRWSDLTSDHQAAVQPDGRFVFDGLPATDAQIVVVCKGWASKLTVVPTSKRSDSAAAEVEAIPQLVDLRTVESFVVAMERTATLEVELRAPDGAPLPGVDLGLSIDSPMWREESHPRELYASLRGAGWSATTDSSGRALFEDIPAGWHWPYATDDEYVLVERARQPDDVNSVDSIGFQAGETVRKTYTLERRRDD